MPGAAPPSGYDPGADSNYCAPFSGGSEPDAIVGAGRSGGQLKNAADRGGVLHGKWD